MKADYEEVRLPLNDASAETEDSGLNVSSHGKLLASYAAMATNRTHTDDGRGEDDQLEPDDIVVLDEDCIVESSGVFPTIKFSDRKNCRASGASAEPDHSTNNMHIDVSRRSESQSTDLYGPWMVVTNRRHRNTNHVVNDQAGMNGSGSGSRFEVLQNIVSTENIDMVQDDRVVSEEVSGGDTMMGGRNVDSVSRIMEQQPQVMRNVVYLESNPTRRQKNDSSGVGVGNHVAVSIVEPVANVRGDPRVKSGISVGHGGRFRKENVNKSPRIRMNVGHIESDWLDPDAVRGVVDMIEDDPGDNMAHEHQDSLVV
ncbi:hypothetical protein V6N11_083850 [Hibiscus sabdariffa]|uniref:Uncharacterized protein n=1 Tax=Hibiscus sabdariffa TaxID=183260 RepID=A0ABR2QD95_9ROSI